MRKARRNLVALKQREQNARTTLLRAIIIVALLAPAMAHVASSGATPRGDDATSAREALQMAMRDLTREAREAKKSFSLPRLNADFAGTFPHDIDDSLIWMRVAKRVDRDPFIDSYIRWQLTSFLDELPALDDAEFEALLGDLPPCLPNPQADESLVNTLMRANAAERLQPSDLKRIEALLSQLGTRREQAGVLRRPAEGLRAWLQEKVGDTGHRPLQVAIERCDALAKAGWDLEDAKADMTARCEAALRDRSFTQEARERIARQMQNLVQPARLRIVDAYVRDDGLVVNTDTVGVYDFEVRKWAKTVLRQ